MSDKIPGSEKKVVAGIFGILLGSLGIHKFYLGYTKEGIIQLVVSLLTCGIGGIIGFIEGIIYLTKSDEEFVATYVTGKKAGSKNRRWISNRRRVSGRAAVISF